MEIVELGLNLFFGTAADIPVCCGIWFLLAVGAVIILLALNRCNRLSEEK